jgi:hypothetical protein
MRVTLFSLADLKRGREREKSVVREAPTPNLRYDLP